MTSMAATLNRIPFEQAARFGRASKGKGVLDILKGYGDTAADVGRKAGKKVLNYNLPSPDNYLKNTVASGAASGALGALTGEKGEKTGRAVHWGIVGALLGRHGPPLLSKGTGRVVTNLIEPFNYDLDKQLAFLKKQKLKNLIKAVYKDTPIYEGSETNRMLANLNIAPKGPYSPREVPYRKMFGLKPRAFKDFFVEDAGSPGVLRYSRTNPAAKRELRNIEGVLNTKKRVDGLPGGKFTLKNTGSTGGSISIDDAGNLTDRWDFAVNSADELKKRDPWIRGLLEMMSNPYTLKDRANLSELAQKLENRAKVKTRRAVSSAMRKANAPEKGRIILPSEVRGQETKRANRTMNLGNINQFLFGGRA